MRTSRAVTLLLLSTAVAVSLGCDTKKKGTDEQLPPKVAPNVEAPPPPPKAPWNEGSFQGKAELAPASAESEGEAKAGSAEPELPKAREPLSLEVVLGTDSVTGSGTSRGETLVVSGISDASVARLTIAGETVRGTFVGHGDEKARIFKGTLRLSRTETLEGKVSTEAYSGEFVLGPVTAEGSRVINP